MAIFWLFGFTGVACVYVGLLSALIVITGTDLSHMMIPDAVTIPGIVIGLVCAVVILPIGMMDSPAWRRPGRRAPLDLGLGQSLCVFGKEGMRGGDIADGHGRRIHRMAAGVVGHYDRIVLAPLSVLG